MKYVFTAQEVIETLIRSKGIPGGPYVKVVWDIYQDDASRNTVSIELSSQPTESEVKA